jgi:hypothetical protein
MEETTSKKKGRPSSFKPEYVEQARKIAAIGATDQELADFFEIDKRTLYRWRHDHPDFCHALKVGKEVADDRVERSLFQKAIGYEQDEVKIFMPAGADAPVYAPFRAKVAPDTTACIFWLKNRRPDLWREKVSHEHGGPDGGAIPVVSVDPSKLSDSTLRELLNARSAGANGS